MSGPGAAGYRGPLVELAEGLEIPRIVTGMWQIADLERDGEVVDPARVATEMRAYVEAGLDTFDMADHYGSAEDIAGVYRERYGSDATFFTKWVPSPGEHTREDVLAAVGRALARLRADAIDLLQFHAWRYCDPGWLDCLFALAELRDAGRIRHLGLTNFDAAHVEMVLESGVPVVSNQVCVSLLDRRALGDMTRVCEVHGPRLLAFGTLAGGFLTDRWVGAPDPAVDGIERLETWSQMKYRRFIEVAGGWDAFQEVLAVAAGIGARRGVSVANVAARYVLEQPAVAAVIIGARLGRSRHIADNADVLGFPFDAEDLATLDAAAASLAPIPGDCGDEYRRPPFLTAAGDLSDHLDGFDAPYPSAVGADGRRRALTGTVWEDLAGFSRAVRDGDRIVVSGTTATHGDRLIGGANAAAQTHFVIDKIEGAIESLGGRLEDVVRTRIYIDREDVWEPVSRAHGARFSAIRPANTLVRAGLIGEGYLVEMEAEAIVRDYT